MWYYLHMFPRRRVVPAVTVLLLLCFLACSRNDKLSYIARADGLASAGKYDEAVLNYRKALQTDPAFGDAYLKLGKLYMTVLNLGDAYAALQRAHELLPERQDVAIAYADVCLAGYLSDRNRFSQLQTIAKGISSRLLSQPQVTFEAHKLAAQVLLADHQVDAAIQHLESANAMRPWKPEVMLSLFDAMLSRGRAAEVEKLSVEAIEHNRSFVPLYELMHRHYVSSKRFEQAEAVLRLRIENTPKDPAATVRLCEYYRISRPEAARACADSIAGNPPTPLGLLAAGDFLRRMGNSDGAIEKYAEGVDLGGNRKQDHATRLVETLVAAGRIPEAKSRVEQIFGKQPGNPYWQRLRAELALDGSPAEIAQSVATLEELAKSFPKDPSFWYSLGRAYEAKKDFSTAAKRYEKATSVDPNYLAPRMAISKMLISLGRHHEALARLRGAREIDPGDSRLLLLESSAFIAVGEYDKAETLLAGFLKGNSSDLEARIQSAYIQLAKGNTQRAESLFAQLASQTKDARVPLGLAQTLGTAGRIDAALKVLETSGVDKDSSVERFRASLFVRAQRYGQAIEIYNRLLAEQPQAADLHAHLGEAHYALGDISAAAAAFEKAEKFGKGESFAGMGMALIKLSRGDHKGAIEIYRRVLAREPNNAAAMNNLAFELAERGENLEEALKLASRAVQLQSEIPDFQDTLGWVYLKKNQPAAARKTFENLARKAPRNPSYRHHLGAALAAEGSKQQAAVELAAALDLKPPAEESRKIEALLRSIR